MVKKMMGIVLACLAVGALGIYPAFAAYKIGAVFSVTGRGSFLGDPEKKTAEMVVQQINEAGGINGEKVELIVYDDEGDATKCNLLVKKLIAQDKVLAVVGPSQSGMSLAVIPVFEKEQTPNMSCAASYKIVLNEKTGKPYKWVFKTAQSDSMAIEAIYSHMQKQGISRIAILSDTSGFGASGREEIARIAPQFGIQIVADEKYDPKDTDMTTQLTKIKGASPQAILNWSIGPTAVTVVRNWRDLQMTQVPFYQSHGFGNRQNIKLAAGAAEGVLCPLGACTIAELLPEDHPQKQVAMDYSRQYTAKFNEPVSSFGGYAWDAVGLVVDAISTVGPDKAKIRDHLENKKNFVGQQGVYNFSADDHNGLTKDAFLMVVVKGDDFALAK